MFTRFARPIDLRQVRTPRPLGVGVGSLGFPDNGLGEDMGTNFNISLPSVVSTPTPSSISASLSSSVQPVAATQTPGITGQDWAQIIGASTGGLLNVIGSIFQVEAARKEAKEREWALENIITAGGTVSPAAGVGISMGTLALLGGAGLVIYMLIRRKK